MRETPNHKERKMYTPKHLEWLDGTKKDQYGWPEFITEEAKTWCRTMLLRGFAKYTAMDLDLARRCIMEEYVVTKEDGPRPECLRLGLWDAQYGVTYRALMDVKATDLFIIPDPCRRPLIRRPLTMADIKGRVTSWPKTLESRSVWATLRTGQKLRIIAVGSKYLRLMTAGGEIVPDVDPADVVDIDGI